MPVRTIEQERASYVLNALNDIRTENQQKEYGSLARGFGTLILNNGLGQALAFLRAKDKNSRNSAYWNLYKHISIWLGLRIRSNQNDTEFLEWIVEQNSAQYRYARQEALDLIIWIKRFAEAKGWTD